MVEKAEILSGGLAAVLSKSLKMSFFVLDDYQVVSMIARGLHKTTSLSALCLTYYNLMTHTQVGELVQPLSDHPLLTDLGSLLRAVKKGCVRGESVG